MRVTKRDFYSISLSFGGGSHTKKHKRDTIFIRLLYI
jgi:hypothetical protein